MNDPDVVAAAAEVLKAAFGDKFRISPPGTASEDFSEFAGAGVPSMMFNIGVYDQERIDAARNGPVRQIPANHSPLFAPVPKPTIETGITAMTLAVLGAFDQKARRRRDRDGTGSAMRVAHFALAMRRKIAPFRPRLYKPLPRRLHCRPTSRARARRPTICANGRK